MKGLGLAELREAAGLTQVQLAEALQTTQGEVSRTERRKDHKVSTLRRYIEALGGRLEFTAVVNERRVKLRP